MYSKIRTMLNAKVIYNSTKIVAKHQTIIKRSYKNSKYAMRWNSSQKM